MTPLTCMFSPQNVTRSEALQGYACDEPGMNCASRTCAVLQAGAPAVDRVRVCCFLDPLLDMPGKVIVGSIMAHRASRILISHPPVEYLLCHISSAPEPPATIPHAFVPLQGSVRLQQAITASMQTGRPARVALRLLPPALDPAPLLLCSLGVLATAFAVWRAVAWERETARRRAAQTGLLDRDMVRIYEN